MHYKLRGSRYDSFENMSEILTQGSIKRFDDDSNLEPNLCLRILYLNQGIEEMKIGRVDINPKSEGASIIDALEQVIKESRLALSKNYLKYH